ncbi:MAG: hypothetical protein KDB22_26905 [Planctomycetales bacterium]|nr:hypothetical protein [Planctomycetales bacterium]
MSSSFQREPLSGLIQQHQRVVGAVCLPEVDAQEFIEQFNHCYGPMGLRILSPLLPPNPTGMLLPVGATHRKPLREPHTD